MAKSKETQEKKKATRAATEKKDGGSGGKGKRKKWSKGRIAEKAANKTYFDKNTIASLSKNIAKQSCITVNKVVNDLKIRGSLARQGMRYLASQGLIAPVSTHSKCLIYTSVAQTSAPVQTKVTTNK